MNLSGVGRRQWQSRLPVTRCQSIQSLGMPQLVTPRLSLAVEARHGLLVCFFLHCSKPPLIRSTDVLLHIDASYLACDCTCDWPVSHTAHVTAPLVFHAATAITATAVTTAAADDDQSEVKP